jgi:hypothetical protein
MFSLFTQDYIPFGGPSTVLEEIYPFFCRKLSVNDFVLYRYFLPQDRQVGNWCFHYIFSYSRYIPLCTNQDLFLRKIIQRFFTRKHSVDEFVFLEENHPAFFLLGNILWTTLYFY